MDFNERSRLQDFWDTQQIEDRNKTRARLQEEVDEVDVEVNLLLEPAMAALNIGLPKREIKRAIREKLERTGFGFQSADDLIENVLKSQEEEHHQVSEFEIQRHLSSEPALTVLNSGLPPGRVKEAIKHKLKRTRSGFASEDALIEAALNIPFRREDEEGRNELLESSATSSNYLEFWEATDEYEGNEEVRRETFNEADVDANLLLEPAMAALNIGLPLGEIKRAIKEKLERTGFGFESEDDLIEDVLKLNEEEHHQVSEFEIQVHLSSEPASTVLDLGLSLRQVKRAITDKLEQTGIGFPSEDVDALLEAALNIPEQEELSVENTALVAEEELSADNIELAQEAELSVDNTALAERNKRRSDERLCKVCMDAEICIVFVPCGHLLTCFDCSRNLEDCPFCRRPIESTVRTFLP